MKQSRMAHGKNKETQEKYPSQRRNSPLPAVRLFYFFLVCWIIKRETRRQRSAEGFISPSLTNACTHLPRYVTWQCRWSLTNHMHHVVHLSSPGVCVTYIGRRGSGRGWRRRGSTRSRVLVHLVDVVANDCGQSLAAVATYTTPTHTGPSSITNTTAATNGRRRRNPARRLRITTPRSRRLLIAHMRPPQLRKEAACCAM